MVESHFHVQLTAVLDVLMKTAVSDICALAESWFKSLHMEIEKSKKENEDLRQKLQSMEQQNQQAAAPTAAVEIKATKEEKEDAGSEGRETDDYGNMETELTVPKGNQWMPRKYQRKTEHGLISHEALAEAVQKVVRKEASLRQAAVESGISKSTLARKVKQYEENQMCNLAADFKKSQVFTLEEENLLEEYLLTSSKMYTPRQCRRLAYETAETNNLRMPRSWHENKMAGRDWFTSFLKRHPRLSIRNSEATSFVRATAFNCHTVGKLFNVIGESDTHPSTSDGRSHKQPFNVMSDSDPSHSQSRPASEARSCPAFTSPECIHGYPKAPKQLESPRGRKKTAYATSTPEMKKMKLGEKQQQEKRQKSAKKAQKELFQKEISQDDLSSEEDEIKLDDSADESSSSDVYTQMIV